MLHTYWCDMRRTITELLKEFPTATVDPDIPDFDHRFQNIQVRNRLATHLRDLKDEGMKKELEKTPEHMEIMRKLLLEMGSTAFEASKLTGKEALTQLANHSYLVESHSTVDSEVANRIKLAFTKIFDTTHGVAASQIHDDTRHGETFVLP